MNKLILKRFAASVLLFTVVGFQAPTANKCGLFDEWIGGVQVSDDTAIPDDAVVTEIMFPKAGIWKYYVIEQDTTYIKIFVDWQTICLYEIRGEGMGLPEFDTKTQAT